LVVSVQYLYPKMSPTAYGLIAEYSFYIHEANMKQ